MYGTYSRLGVSIHASDRTVIRALRRKFKRSALRRECRALRHTAIRACLNCHHEARALARHFAL